MEALVELLLQVLFEVFGELILTAITKVIGLFFKSVDRNNLFKRRIKLGFTYTFIGIIMTVIIHSLINSTTFLVVISLSYMLFQIILTLLQIMNKDRIQSPLMVFVSVLKKISHYVYPILMIVFSSIFMDKGNLLTTIITIFTLVLAIWLTIDLYRIWKRKNQVVSKHT